MHHGGDVGVYLGLVLRRCDGQTGICRIPVLELCVTKL
jgi:hypothetical protein